MHPKMHLLLVKGMLSYNLTSVINCDPVVAFTNLLTRQIIAFTKRLRVGILY